MIKKIMKKMVCFLLVITISISYFFASIPNASAAAQTIADLKKELASLKAQKAEQESSKQQTQSEINNKKNAIYSAYNEKEEINNQVEDAKAKIVESEASIEKITNETEELLRFLQVINGENSYLEYISGASTTTELIMRISAVEQLTDYNKTTLEELKNLIKEKQDLQVELANKQEELNNKINNYNSAISDLNDHLDEIAEITDGIDDQIKNQQALIDYYKTVCTSETQKLSECVRVAASTGWLRPLAKGVVTSNWGYRGAISGVSSSFHNGIDIGGNSEGTKIYATAAGTVAAIVRKASCGGNGVYIHHLVNGVAYTTTYRHLLTINVSVGDAVTTNTVIGTVGGGKSTSSYDKCSTGAHLHYGLTAGYYLGGGTYGYSSYSTYIAKSKNPGFMFPSKGVWFYSR